MLLATVVYAYHFYVVFRQLRKRRALIASYADRVKGPPPLRRHVVSDEEYKALLSQLVAKVWRGVMPPRLRTPARLTDPDVRRR